jgi:flagellar hook protein FlgE
MALIGSLGSGVSAMQSFVKGMEVIGNNIANSKTVGFKKQRATYTDSFSQTLKDASPGSDGTSNSAPIQVGAGVVLGATQKIFRQGSIELTGVASDLAISGDGFFRVFDVANQQQLLTRDGSFRVDENGYLADKSGNFLLGITGGSAFNEPTTLGRVQVGLSDAVRLNNSGQPIDEIGRIVLADGTRAFSDANSSSGFFRVDSEGRLLDSTTVGSFDFNAVQAVILDEPIGGTTARAALHSDGNYYLIDDLGNYIDSAGAVIQDSGPANVVFDPAGTAPTTAGGDTSDAVVWDPVLQISASISDGASADADAIWDEATSTLAAADPDVSDTNQFTLAIQNWTINKEGSLRLSLNDGSSYVRAQVLLQNVQDPDALTEEGSGLFSGMENAGVIGLAQWNVGQTLTALELSDLVPNQGGVGFLQSRALEGSNTDLTQEFSDMITTQRAFQAGSKVISVSDEMLQEIINLKR